MSDYDPGSIESPVHFLDSGYEERGWARRKLAMLWIILWPTWPL